MSRRLEPYREILGLAAPIAGIQFAQVALTSTDLLMMGLIGIDAIAAGGLALLLYNQLRTMGVGTVTGLGNLIAGAVGRGEKRTGTSSPDEATRDEVRNLLRAAMLLATIVGVAAGTALIAFGWALPWFGQPPEVVAIARPVMLALAPGLLPMLWLNVLRQFAVGMRRAGSLLGVTIASIAVNAALNATFIYGWIGLPQLGVAGIGISTTFVQLWSFVVYLRIVRRDPILRDLLALDGWKADRATVMTIARLGGPIALTYGSEAAITSIATMLVGTFGAAALAASNVVNQLAYIVYQLNIGLSQGASILVSRTAGRGRHEEIAALARRTFIISFGAMTLIGLAYVLAPQAILRPFLGENGDAAVSDTARVLLWFAIAHQFLKGSQNLCIGLLRGLGNTRSGLTSTFIGYWLIGIPAMAACGRGLDWGAPGVWFGLCIGFGATALLLVWRFGRDLRSVPQTRYEQAVRAPAAAA
ncbi:MATE family efflux transporter [Methylobacterium sp. E-045]|uniref:MATE family efflux transporter n=1 Tax=Methylobacterium sp. E-045 TaxID=2836575 RepID=UPI001FB9999C|nr:MATE family efflux transporter [Methylobacterium sp. E-045]MCJ2131710.1 MATE family efflux transporter [Methylobacterium sp. E-045]